MSPLDLRRVGAFVLDQLLQPERAARNARWAATQARRAVHERETVELEVAQQAPGRTTRSGAVDAR